MLVNFVDKVSTFLDRRFLLAYWTPAFIGLCLGLTTAILRDGFVPAVEKWEKFTETQQFLLTFFTLLAITILAYLLQALTTPLIRAYEGYWPPWLALVRHRAELRQQRIKQRAMTRGDQRTLYYNFPYNDAHIRATRLGNTMTSAEEYPYLLYRADAIIWWPRLIPLLPAEFQTMVDGAFAPIVALLNLSMIFGLWTLYNSIQLINSSLHPIQIGLLISGGGVIAWGCYRGAITQAENFGDLIRVAFDLYRHEPLKKMRIPLPNNLSSERILWYKLGQLHYYHNFPWDLSLSEVDLQLPADPFYYTDDPNKRDSKDKAND